MPTHLLCASWLIYLFVPCLRLLCALLKLPGAFHVLHAKRFQLCFVLWRGCYLFPSLVVVPRGLSLVAGLPCNGPEVP